MDEGERGGNFRAVMKRHLPGRACDMSMIDPIGDSILVPQQV